MRASMRGSIRSVMVTDSDASALPAVAASIRRRSGLFSDQKSDSAFSLSKIGTSSQLANVRIFFPVRPRRHPRPRIFDFEDDEKNDFFTKASGPFSAGKK